MRFDIITIFPEFFQGPLNYGIVRRARETGLIEVALSDLREFTSDRHRSVDDRPFGGGEGMVLKPEPLFACVESLLSTSLGDAARREPLPPDTAVVLFSASGKPFVQETAARLSGLGRVILICGRYEGVDERVAAHLASDEISVGDYVLSGGELPAALVLDAVTRLLPGALGNEDSAVHESFSAPADSPEAEFVPATEQRTDHPTDDPSHATGRALLDCPHYTRPADFRGWGVPEVLLSGNHEDIRRWRREAALEKTRHNRPDLLKK